MGQGDTLLVWSPLMFKYTPLLLSIVMVSCVHFKDYVHPAEPLTDSGKKVNLASREAVASCQSQTMVVGKGQAHGIHEAVAAAIKNGRNKAGTGDRANTLLYIKTAAFQRWRTHYVAIQFHGYSCAEAIAMEPGEARAHANASAEAQVKIQEQARAQAAQTAAAQAAALAAAAAAAQAAAHAAQTASQAASQAAMFPPMF
jgi:hypothetical protein